MKNGEVLGNITISPELAAAAEKMARHYFANQVKSEFMESADICIPPAGMGGGWIPRKQLAALGYRVPAEKSQWVMSTGIDMHVDRIWGETLMWVVHNDGLHFKQGRVKVVHQPGEWFIFNDALPHQVDIKKPTDAGEVWIGWAVKIERK